MDRISLERIFLIAVLAFAAFMYFFRIGERMMFIGDFGWYYLSAREMLLNGEIPLVGISSSVPVFKQGAIWTWLLGLSLMIGKFNPISGAVLTGAVGVISIWGVFKLVSSWFSEKAGLIAAILATTSPLIIVHTRMPFITALIFPITLLVAWTAAEVAKGKKKHFFFARPLSFAFISI